MAASAKLAFTPTTIKLHSFNEFNVKLPLTQFTQLTLWFVLIFTQAELILQSKLVFGQVSPTAHSFLFPIC